MRLLVFIIICTTTVQPCLHNGEHRSAGETWVDGRFKLQCIESETVAQVEIIGCVTPYGHEMSIGSHYQEGETEYHCKKTDDDGFVLEAVGY
ncbi:hypothetical protein GCK32_014826 [Trichostrongylus colubriformis]|uniref:Abnormal cell migration protein 18-like fibronectin type I domain-containing protein n=1 Tax=Trichostrongylus colubriformis TaxID=6319 RepID=A0AAN8IWE8_TRICO